MSIHVVTGTDTGIGKTVFAAGLAAALGAHYWKPIQAGVEADGDKEEVARLSGLQVNDLAHVCVVFCVVDCGCSEERKERARGRALCK